MLTAAAPTLVNVTGSVTLVPKAMPPKPKSVGDNSTSDPRPVTTVVCGLLESLSLTVIFPVLIPVPFGLKVTQTLQAGEQLPSVLCGLKIVPAVQYVSALVEQFFTAVQLCPVTENCELLLAIESIVNVVGREL